MVHEITTVEEFETIISENALVVVDYYADWCMPCKRIASHLEELSLKYMNIKVCKVNTDELSELSDKYEVQGLPTILFFKEKKVVKTIVGADFKLISSTFEDFEKL